ncbi:hypothetical protein [Acanthopleuribacter pedis]|uniref:Uncharacterized protein n=1 Tax=Acanthopleuribacter pedis TaxID=442870 RepID=A0A8J7QJF5_9BACT|nr:hypothetical protein [Acanthopleuribacter pedis]MBO1319315.1 hypothetical protein [Acanthopleuribacter pedis]
MKRFTAFCLIALCLIAPLTAADQYSLVIDAGSSGSRIYIYKVQPNQHDELPAVTYVDSSSVNPGISDWNEDPAAAKANLQTLVDFAKEKVPADAQKTTPLRLMATAGMRMPIKKERDQIMNDVNGFFSADGSFAYKGGVILAGSYEALYSWIALNYSNDQFDPAQAREGILEMGGASTQIAFHRKKAFKRHHIGRTFRGKEYNVYARSYLFMGQVEAMKLSVDSPCYPKKYPMDFGFGTGDFDDCSNEIMERFNSICENMEHSRGPHCIFMNPVKSRANISYFAVPAFKETFEFFGLTPDVDLNTLAEKGREYCAMDWDALKEQYSGIHPFFLKTFCYNAAYFHTLIKEGYGFEDRGAKILPNDGSWTLGAVIDTNLGNEPAEYKAGKKPKS